MNTLRRSLRFLRFWLLMTVFGFSSLWGADVRLPGKLVYVAGSQILEVDLSSGTQRVLYSHRYSLNVPITRVNEGAFSVSSIESEILLVYLDGRVVSLGPGSSPFYLEKHQTLFYFSNFPDKRVPRLFASHLAGDSLSAVREIDAGPFGAAPPLLAISEDQVLFYRPDGGVTRAFTYDVRSHKITQLPISGCRPNAWLSGTKKLLCAADGAHWTMKLDGSATTEVPELKHIAVGVASMTGNRVLGSRGRLKWLTEHSDLVVYDLDTRKVSVIAKDVPLVNSTGIWIE